MPRPRPTDDPSDHRWASLNTAADYSCVPVRTLRVWIAEGRLPAYRMGPRLLQVDLNDVDALRTRVPTRSASTGTGTTDPAIKNRRRQARVS